ncbi:hypothetical protein HFO42_07480 [Rhizobium leguminosarum]|uniref:Uncharacterized protein n=1 Tax=Rhizobium leguminosarum TaxID=384 RepID=A0AAJ1A633_RHILE|nr:hypothetical protein [Rhizobium leguminosarum]MBY5532842.1 hypothetical protein [Rhizobium leguminosarum]MBY5594280.1 hypothetical protein [Rhizobium leguminosarum]MBY5627957.1 hypothetical protein [Rhizobium leguminosarum]
MQQLALKHEVEFRLGLAEPVYKTTYMIKLSWGTLATGEGYDGLVKALMAIQHDIECCLQNEAAEEREEVLRKRHNEIETLKNGYLAKVKTKAEVTIAQQNGMIAAMRQAFGDVERRVLDPSKGGQLEFITIYGHSDEMSVDLRRNGVSIAEDSNSFDLQIRIDGIFTLPAHIAPKP